MWRADPYVIKHYFSQEKFPTWILFHPDEPEKGKDKIISVGHGTNRNYPQGPCLEPKEMLEWVPSLIDIVERDGKMIEVYRGKGSPGWFLRQCEMASCQWFYALVERMAAGEEVPIEEIQSAYRENNGGKELEQKPVHELTDC